jgi:type II secretory pathway pseudopilin PulG
MKNLIRQTGFSMIEILVVIALVSTMGVLIIAVSVSNNKLRYINEERTQVLFYSTQALEAMKLMTWNDLDSGDYSVELSGNEWILNSGSQLLDNKYTRTIGIEDVYRLNSSNGHSYGAIVTTGGYLDPDTKKIISTIDWYSKAGNNRSEVFQTYLHRWKAERWTQTDWVGGDGQSDWSDTTQFNAKDAGVDINVAGIATLQSGFIDWSVATTTSNFDTEGHFNENDVYEIDGIAYLVTESNTLAIGSEFYVLDVNDIYNPSELKSLDIGTSVNSVVAKGDYAYLATDGNDKELVTINVATPSSAFIESTYDIDNPNNDNAYDVVAGDTELYLARGDYLYSFSLIDPANPSYLDRINVGNQARELFLSENYVYIATEESDAELQIIDVSNPANLNQIGEYNLDGNLKGTGVFVLGNTAYISTQNNGGDPEFFIFEISDPSDPVYIGDYNFKETIHSFAVVGPYVLAGTGFLNEELTVIDVSVPATPSPVSSFELSGYILGLSANCSVIYAATSSNDGEFFIISTENPDCGYADYGTLESSTFDTGSTQVTYNWLSFTGSQPVDTDIRFQVATSNNSSGPWSYKGPDGTSSTYYSIAAQEMINYNSHLDQRYLRYKLFLNSDSSWEVPILEEVTISYSIYP